jgi:hypothetical protein
MRVLIALVLFSALALGQKMLVEPAPGAGPKSAAEKEAIDKLVDLLSEQIQDQIPCSRPSSMDEVRDMISEARDKETVGTATGNELAQVLDKVGVRDVVSVNVTAMGGQMVATVVWMDMQTARAKARQTSPVSGDEASLDDFARKFASSMKAQSGSNAGRACEPDKEWYGTLRATLRKEERLEQNTDDGDGVCKKKTGSDSVWRITVRIPRQGRATAFATLVRKNLQEWTCVRRGWCGKNYYDGKRHGHQLEEYLGAANVQAETMFETVNGMLSGGATLDTMPVQLKLSGGTVWEATPCAPGKTVPGGEQTVTTQLVAPGITLPAQPLKPGQRTSRGTWTDQGLTIEWRLTRTGK